MEWIGEVIVIGMALLAILLIAVPGMGKRQDAKMKRLLDEIEMFDQDVKRAKEEDQRQREEYRWKM